MQKCISLLCSALGVSDWSAVLIDGQLWRYCVIVSVNMHSDVVRFEYCRSLWINKRIVFLSVCVCVKKKRLGSSSGSNPPSLNFYFSHFWLYKRSLNISAYNRITKTHPYQIILWYLNISHCHQKIREKEKSKLYWNRQIDVENVICKP